MCALIALPARLILAKGVLVRVGWVFLFYFLCCIADSGRSGDRRGYGYNICRVWGWGETRWDILLLLTCTSTSSSQLRHDFLYLLLFLSLMYSTSAPRSLYPESGHQASSHMQGILFSTIMYILVVNLAIL